MLSMEQKKLLIGLCSNASDFGLCVYHLQKSVFLMMRLI